MLVHDWARIYHADPALNKHWSVTCHRLRQTIRCHGAICSSGNCFSPEIVSCANLASCQLSQYNPANTKHIYDICTTSTQRHRRWSNLAKYYTNALCLPGSVLHKCSIGSICFVGNFGNLLLSPWKTQNVTCKLAQDGVIWRQNQRQSHVY